MSLQIDMSEMPPGVVEEFRKGRVAREVATLVKQPRLQDMLAREFQTDNRSIDGLGRLRMTVSADAFHYWGRRLGYACWKDQQFLCEFERDNPNVRVKCGGTKAQVGYGTGFKFQVSSFQPKASRFRKVYEEKPVGGTPAAR